MLMLGGNRVNVLTLGRNSIGFDGNATLNQTHSHAYIFADLCTPYYGEVVSWKINAIGPGSVRVDIWKKQLVGNVYQFELMNKTLIEATQPGEEVSIDVSSIYVFGPFLFIIIFF